MLSLVRNDQPTSQRHRGRAADRLVAARGGRGSRLGAKHYSTITSMTFGADEALISGCDFGTLVATSTRNTAASVEAEPHSGAVTALESLDGGTFVSAGEDGVHARAHTWTIADARVRTHLHPRLFPL